MIRKIVSKVYKCVQGIWTDISYNSGTLADELKRLGITIDDNTQFCRIIDIVHNRIIEYRCYNGSQIRIDIISMS